MPIIAKRFQHGEWDVGSEHPGWNLHEGSGDRVFEARMAFTTAMDAAPLITLSLSGFDCEADGRVKIHLSYEKVTHKTFSVMIKTTGECKIHRVKFAYFAVVKDE